MKPPLKLSALLLLATGALSGCSALSALGDASQPLEVYELRTPDVAAAPTRRSVEVIIEEPIASGALSTERIMIRPSPLQAQYLPEVRWSDTAPVMLQTLMVRTLSETGALGSVGRRPVGTRADYAVLSELTDFQAEASPEVPTGIVRVRLISRVVQEGGSRVVASRTFTASEVLKTTEPDAVVVAFNLATARLLLEFSDWVLRQAR